MTEFPDTPAAAGVGNVLGALALVLTDRTAAAAAEASDQSASAAAALSALHRFLDGPTLDQLRRVLGLTPSGAVRLVDRLAAAGLVTRGAGGDGRSRSVALTAAGRDAAERIGAARAEVLNEALDGFSAADRDHLGALLGRVMANVVRAKDGGAWICRLCDLAACGRPTGDCPAANAAAAKYGPPPRTPG
ncbi:MarR family winged helix-turn-helix transcriptional regulator [Plantactinospora siamensis]|uniref:MarR family winged helix-turn-helix transcriptional regulator n=1 Tax=Plantactinospora siamensis TaxID=555372 RepID=A0ABV6NQQ8_9ACTN